jgi:hypothetical protein
MDRRDRDFSPWWDDVDFSQMKAFIDYIGNDEVMTVNLCWEVCGTCNGKGTHVNPGIDAHGLSREDFDADPDFREEYFSGAYDIPCNECHGRTTVAIADPDHNTPEALEAVYAILQDRADYAAECAAERKMGA